MKSIKTDGYGFDLRVMEDDEEEEVVELEFDTTFNP